MSMKPGDFGTVGFLDISRQNRRIGAIKLCFDFEYNPVCFIVNSDEIHKTFGLLDENDQKAEWTEDELAQCKGIHERNPYDTMAWSEVRDGVALELRHHSGLWALKGDRVNGS